MRKFNGFSLMEMMVVLLIVAIVIAASAPMISKRMVRTAEGGSPWLFSGINGSIFFNGNGNNRTAMIGRSVLPDGAGNPRLLIDAGNNDGTAALSVYRAGNFIANLIARDGSVGFAGLASGSTQDNSVYLGTNQTISSTKENDSDKGFSVAIGHGVTVEDDSVVIGSGANVKNKGWGSVVIGKGASASGQNGALSGIDDSSIAIGSGANSNSIASIAIGESATVDTHLSVAIGDKASVGENSYCSMAIGSSATVVESEGSKPNSYSVAIGANATVNTPNTIVLGTKSETVYIPGNLVVDGDVVLGRNSDKSVYVRLSSSNAIFKLHSWNDDYGNALIIDKNSNIKDQKVGNFSFSSDRRLKNVGEMFAGGLEQVKKLEVYNYTFKKDSANTPRVGVMAQDLMKVFPNAVTKGEDGYLRIRMEDMFYAVVNAVKELDNKLTAIAEQLKTIADDMSILKNKDAEYEKVITELVEQNKALMKKNAEFEERLAKLEGKAIKKETKEMTKSVKQESKLAKQEEKAKLKAQKQAEKEAQKAEKTAAKAAKKAEKEAEKSE